jgi:deoxyinosine 3'endonuclease (endonuclease V)
VAACVGDNTTLVPGAARAPYEPGLLALREGALLETAVRALPELPEVATLLQDLSISL